MNIISKSHYNQQWLVNTNFYTAQIQAHFFYHKKILINKTSNQIKKKEKEKEEYKIKV